MVLELVRKSRPGVQHRPRHSVPGGVRVYAIGDVHGRVDLLDQVLADIDAHLAASPAIRSIRIFLGDYVDRGPDSREVVERLIACAKNCETVYLKGNHEDFVFTFLQNPAALEEWRHVGGLETLVSYGLKPSVHPGETETIVLAEQFADALPEVHRDFLRGLRTSFTLGDFFFVHAGVKPGVPLEAQRDSDLLWIRHEFLGSAADFGKMVVHGHTPVPDPEIRPNRINIDTGAYATGRLTCLVIEGDQLNWLADLSPRSSPVARGKGNGPSPAAENVIRATQDTLRAADQTMRAAKSAAAVANAPFDDASLVPADDPLPSERESTERPGAAPEPVKRSFGRRVATPALVAMAIVSAAALWGWINIEVPDPVTLLPPELEPKPQTTGISSPPLRAPKPAVTEPAAPAPREHAEPANVPPQDTPPTASPANAARPAEIPTAAEQPKPVRRSPQDLAVLLARGQSLVAEGDISAARLLLRRGAEAGDPRAALALAATYDPALVEKLGIRGIQGDKVMARTWYEIAAQLGSAEAGDRLKSLMAENR